MAFGHCNPWLHDKQRPKKHAEICIFLPESNGRIIGNVGKRQMAKLCELGFRAQIYEPIRLLECFVKQVRQFLYKHQLI